MAPGGLLSLSARVPAPLDCPGNRGHGLQTEPSGSSAACGPQGRSGKTVLPLGWLACPLLSEASGSWQTTLCNTSLDNPTQRGKDQLIQAAAKFLDTDTICYRVEEPETLVELQRNEWDPVIGWAERRYGVKIGSSTSIMGPSIPARTREVLVSHLASYNTWALQGIEFVVSQLKSMVLTLGLIDLHLTVEQAVLLSRLEETFQIQKWGNVEWAHDYEVWDLQARTAAGALFVHLCSESSAVKHKLLQG
ncbi:ATP synthase mitochondrial F1 complex assembly factor 2 isoform X2 [Balaenoptera ricei]|uniref:ATP synthase mitochondrial F1 complex assembly factor 2 isoform X2 n=1 Tax=Balaenoptera ricei TaxID=2746895 RepID=UPI0028BDDABA|nr:ATP synthase mitochondrial F1 complex assembly factor 2 isoform X2 [Balaenoptera ricei]